MRNKTNLRYIYKIHSSRLRKSNWNLNLTIPEAINNDELVSIADNQDLRWINKDKNIDEIANKIIKDIKKIRKLQFNKDNKDKIKKLYIDLYNTLFVKDYICVIIDNEKDFDRMNSNRKFFINGVKFIRLLGTNGGVKKSTIVYVSEKVYNELHTKIENGRNIEKPLVPAKYESYRSLSCSASTPVSSPNGLLIIKDCEVEFEDNIILLDDTQTEYPKLEYIENYKIKYNENDGYGLISPEFSERWSQELGENYIASGFCIRNSFCKGMVFTFDFKSFASKIAKNNIVEDAWGVLRNIEDVELILTTSMLKLWDSYSSMEDYLENCNKNEYTFSVTKITPEVLENERYLNYQFLQSYEFTDEDINELISPTVEEIRDVLGEDPIKSILFLKGSHLNEESYYKQESDFVKALMIDKKMINDPFIKNKIHYMIKKRIKESKMGVLKVNANFSIISGDPYSLCQSMFKMNVTGLLKKGEFYSKYWNDKNVNKVACFRAPMTCHNNIRILNFKNTEDMQDWYKYMTTVTILNSWDTTTHALNGADKDADAIFTTNNPVLLRRTRELPAVLCVQKTASKHIITEELLMQSNKDGFGDEIGSTTNKITNMIDVAARYDKNSKEYKELDYRIICGQNYQQNAIDKMKGIICKPMPKEWYDYFEAKNSTNKEFNLSILADKKPYFFIYNYKREFNKYKKYIDSTHKNCINRFNVTLEELLESKTRNEQEENFVKYYYKKMPVSINKSTMNRICWKLEEEFDKLITEVKNTEFDSNILKSNVEYSLTDFNKIKKLYTNYTLKVQEHMQTRKDIKTTKEDIQITRFILKESFKNKAYEICPNEKQLCNIVIDLCYNNNSSKQFAWDICGDIIIENLLENNNNTIQYPIADTCGNIMYGGENFSLYTKQLDCEDEYEINYK